MLPRTNSKHILIVDQDAAAVEGLRCRLAELGFDVRVIADGASALQALTMAPPHLVILDSHMPGFAALELIQRRRSAPGFKPVRLIILSSLASEHEIVSGLDLGADDYVTKPFSVREVVARVWAVLRCQACEDDDSQLCFEDLVLNSSSNRVTARGKLVSLRAVEYRLLEFLMAHAGRAFNRAQLLMNVWGDDRDVDERTVDVNVQRLRKILGGLGYDSCIETVRGFGYRFAASPQRAGPSIMAYVASDVS